MWTRATQKKLEVGQKRGWRGRFRPAKSKQDEGRSMRVRGPSGGVPQALRGSPVSPDSTFKAGSCSTFLHIKCSRQSCRKSSKAVGNVASLDTFGKVIGESGITPVKKQKARKTVHLVHILPQHNNKELQFLLQMRGRAPAYVHVCPPRSYHHRTGIRAQSYPSTRAGLTCGTVSGGTGTPP